MATFSTWWKAFQDGKGLRPITFICGPERVLIDEVEQGLWDAVSGWNKTRVILTTGADERWMWEQAERVPQWGGNALTVVRHAQLIKDTDRIMQWWKQKKNYPNCYLILVSDEDTAPHAAVGDPREHKTELVPYLQYGTGGWVIECKPFTQATVKTAIQWVRCIAPMTEQVAGHLLNRADGNLRLVRDTCRKLAVFEGTITQSVVNDLLSQQPRDSFVDALLAMDKKTALEALARTDKQDFSRVLGLLDSMLELAGTVHDSQLNNKPRYELLKAAGKRAWLVPDIEKVSKHYDLKRRVRNRQLLLMADEALSGGETVGVLEAVTALW